MQSRLLHKKRVSQTGQSHWVHSVLWKQQTGIKNYVFSKLRRGKMKLFNSWNTAVYNFPDFHFNKWLPNVSTSHIKCVVTFMAQSICWQQKPIIIIIMFFSVPFLLRSTRPITWNKISLNYFFSLISLFVIVIDH